MFDAVFADKQLQYSDFLIPLNAAQSACLISQLRVSTFYHFNLRENTK